MAEQSDKKVLRLTCPICETRLKVAEDINRFACLNCGTELDVVKVGNIASLSPVVVTSAPQLTQAEQRLAEINAQLKARDDGYGLACGVITLGITLIACITILLANVFQSQFLFWGAIIVALVLLAVALLVLISGSGRSAAPLMRERDHLQREVEMERQANLEAEAETEIETKTEMDTDTEMEEAAAETPHEPKPSAPNLDKPETQGNAIG